MRALRLPALAALAALLLSPAPAAAELKVVVTIKPLHALAAQIMDGIGTPSLLVSGNASPHTYALKPSDARAVNAADVFIRVAEELEPFTSKVVASIPGSVRVETLEDAPGVRLLRRRKSAAFEAHGHEEATHGHGAQGHGEGGEAHDAHIWLDPRNARAMTKAIAAALAERSPADAAAITANAARLDARLAELDAELERELQTVVGKPFVVFHDAYQYLEARYGLSAVGSITVSPEIQPSAKRLSQMRAKIASLSAVCVFAEPQFNARLLATVTEGTTARTGTLDPEGGRIAPGPGLYFALMRNLAASLKACLGAG